MAKVTIENILPAHSRAARALLNMKVTDLAALNVGLSVDKVKAFENGRPASDRTRKALIEAIEGAGVELLNGGKPGARVSNVTAYEAHRSP